jgi:hypothetical protein
MFKPYNLAQFEPKYLALTDRNQWHKSIRNSQPLNPKHDQPGNSARVLYYGLGERANPRKESIEIISEKLKNILENYHVYENNMMKMNENISDSNNFLF